MSLARRTVGYLSVMGSTQVVQFLLQLASAAILGRLLIPDDYGIFHMASVVMGISLMFRELGLRQSAIRAETLTGDQEAVLVRISAGISLVCAGGVAIGAPIAVAIFQQPEVFPVTMSLVAPTFIGGLGLVPAVKLARDHRFTAAAFINLSAAALGMGTAVALAYHDAGVWALVGQVWIVAIVTGLAPWLCAPASLRVAAPTSVRGIAGLGAWLASSSLLWQGGEQLQKTILGATLSPAALGHFQRARDLTGTPITILRVPFATVGLPVLSSLQDQTERFQRALLRMSASTELLLCLPVALLVACSSNGILLLLGPQWAEAARLAPWLAMLLVGAGSISGPLNWILVIRARGKLQLVVQAIGSGIAVVALTAGLLTGGALGAVMGLVASHVVVTLIRVHLIVPVTGMSSLHWLRVLSPFWLTQAVAGVCGYLVTLATPTWGPIAQLVGSAVVATLVCAASILLVPARRALLTESLALLRRERTPAEPAGEAPSE